MTQLSELNTRVRTHISAFWQIGFAYLGIIALGFGLADLSSSYLSMLAAGLGVIGIFVLLAMYGWREGARRAVLNIQGVEAALGLDETAETRFWSHELPHFLIVVVGIAFCVGVILNSAG